MATADLNDVPDKVKSILREFIEEGSYYPLEYFTSFEINRINFKINGQSSFKKYRSYQNIESPAMILCTLLISRVFIRDILFQILMDEHS